MYFVIFIFCILEVLTSMQCFSQVLDLQVLTLPIDVYLLWNFQKLYICLQYCKRLSLHNWNNFGEIRYSAVLLQPQVVVVQIMSAQHVSFTHGFPVHQVFHYFSSYNFIGGATGSSFATAIFHLFLTGTKN